MADSDTPIDLNDPATWPDDVDSLHELANKGIAGGEEDGVVVEDFPDDIKLAEKTADDVQAAATGDDDKAGDDQAGDDQAGDDDKADDDDAAHQQATQQQTPSDGDQIAGVLTKDGKHFLPYQVFVDLKTKNTELEQQLKQRIGAPAAPATHAPANGASQQQAPAAAQQAAASDAARPMWQRPENEIQEHLNKIREEYGDVIAQQELTLMQMQAQAAQEKEDRERLLQAQEEERIRQLQALVEQNPLLTAWRDDMNSPWYDRASELHDQLVKFDPQYAAKPQSEQFELLTDKVEAIYGESPHRKTISKLPDNTAKPNGADPTQQTQSIKRVPVDEKLAQAASQPPTSMSQIPGGAATEVSDIDKLKGLSERQIMGLLESQSVDDMNAFLGQIS